MNKFNRYVAAMAVSVFVFTSFYGFIQASLEMGDDMAFAAASKKCPKKNGKCVRKGCKKDGKNGACVISGNDCSCATGIPKTSPVTLN